MFEWPDDMGLFVWLYGFGEDMVVGGGVAEHMIMRPNQEKSFKDVDIIVTSRFLNSMAEKFALLAGILRKGQLTPCRFDVEGRYLDCAEADDMSTKKIYIFLRGVTVEAFVSDRLPEHEAIVYEGFSLKATSLANRLASIDSMVASPDFAARMPSLLRRKRDVESFLVRGNK